MNGTRLETNGAWLSRLIAVGVCVLITHGELTAAQVSTRYSPFHPKNNEAVTVTIKASDLLTLASVELFAYEYVWEDLNLMKRRTDGLWGLVRSWDLREEAPTEKTLTHVLTGFPPNSFVSLVVRVTPLIGDDVIDYWGFTAGDWAFGSEPIPLWLVPPSAGSGGGILASAATPATNRLNVVFIAQEGEYASAGQMLPDIERMVFEDYMEARSILQGKQLWAFHYSPELGHISEYDGGDSAMKLTETQIVTTNMNANVGAIVHKSTFRDWAGGHFFGTEVGAGNFGTTLHEIGHSVFRLDDEYDGTGVPHATSELPFHNNWPSQADCDGYCLLQGQPLASERIGSSTWWRPEPTALQCVMLVGNGVTNPEFGWSCSNRVHWFYQQLVP